MKLLLWLAIAVAVVWLLRPRRPRHPRGTGHAGRPPGARNGLAQAEAMLQCRQCGIYLPSSDAVLGDAGEPYCCDAHRAAHSQS